jgi:hypothetical protein
VIITHKNLKHFLDRLQQEPEFQIGALAPNEPERERRYLANLDAWYRRRCWLEVATGELAKDALTSLALIGREHAECLSLDGTEGFNAQGLEGKVRIPKDLFMALMAMRDIVPEHRGRIIVEGDLP